MVGHGSPGAPRTRRLLPIVAAVLALAGCAGSSQATSDASVAPELSDAQRAAASKSEQVEAGTPGPYAVGRRTITVTDDTRPGRTFPVDVWYPVDKAATTGVAPAEYSFLPGLGYTSTNAYADAPAAAGDFPLLVYSHGGGGFRWVATFFTEFMASKGYVVVAPDHPGSTALDLLTGAAVDENVNAFNRPGDITATLDTVLAADANPADPLAGRIDDTQIALSGHSWGGYTSLATISGHTNALGTTTPDPRVKALVLMAPYTEMLTDAELAKVTVPVLVFSGTKDDTTPIAGNTDRPASLIPGRPLLRLDLTDAVHNSFTDVCRLRDSVAANPNVPAAVTAELDRGAKQACSDEALDVAEVQRITDSYTTAFLAQELQGSDSYPQMLDCVAPPKDAVCAVKP